MAVEPPLSGVLAGLVGVNAVFHFGAVVGLIGAGLFI